MEHIYREVGEKIRAKRRQLGLTLEDLAELSGLPAGYIGQIERGGKKASLRSVSLLAQGLGLPVGRLFADGAAKDAGVAEQVEAVLRANNAAEKKVLLSMLRHLSRALKELR